MVNAWVQASDAILCQYTGSRISPDHLPLRLPGHDTLTLYFPATDIEQLVKMVNATQDATLMGGWRRHDRGCPPRERALSCQATGAH